MLARKQEGSGSFSRRHISIFGIFVGTVVAMRLCTINLGTGALSPGDHQRSWTPEQKMNVPELFRPTLRLAHSPGRVCRI